MCTSVKIPDIAMALDQISNFVVGLSHLAHPVVSTCSTYNNMQSRLNTNCMQNCYTERKDKREVLMVS